MYNNLKRFIFLIIFIIAFTNSINAQKAQRFSISITTGISKTGSLEYGDQYRLFIGSPTINIIETGMVRNKHANFSFSYQPIKSLSLNASVGSATYGFRFSADVVASPSNTTAISGFVSREYYTIHFTEIGFSLSYRLAIHKDVTFIIQPGIALYTNSDEFFPQLMTMFIDGNNFSATFFTGVEVPIANDSFFVSAGLITKAALGNFATFYDFENQFHPYAIGLQASISYRF